MQTIGDMSMHDITAAAHRLAYVARVRDRGLACAVVELLMGGSDG